VQVLDLLIESAPDSAEEYKQRGVCHVQVGRFEEARNDLEAYLRLAPKAPDKAQVAVELERIRRLLSLRA
jgi:regulator of sirC expression with transglutaminase-like and TPR domain